MFSPLGVVSKINDIIDRINTATATGIPDGLMPDMTPHIAEVVGKKSVESCEEKCDPCDKLEHKAFPAMYQIFTRHDSRPDQCPQHIAELKLFTTDEHIIEELVQAWNNDGVRDCSFTYKRIQ